MFQPAPRFNDPAFRLFLCSLILLCLCGCGEYRSVWHEQKLPSGRSVKVTSLHLVWGAEHDERDPGKDCFAMEYVMADPAGDAKTHEQEVREVFELIRPVSELWGFKSAEVAAFPTADRKGRYDWYLFVREADGKWSFKVESRKVFAND